MWLDEARRTAVHDPTGLTDLLLGRSPVDVARLHRAEPWLVERVGERLAPPDRDEVLAALVYDLPLATCLRLRRARSLVEARSVLVATPAWVAEEIDWLWRREPQSREATVLRDLLRVP